MCKRIEPLTLAEAEEALANRARDGRAVFGRHAGKTGSAGTAAGSGARRDAYPGSEVPVFVPQEDGRLKAVLATWGFWGQRPPARAAGKTDAPVPKLIFNTRLDTAERQLHDGRGLWAQAIAHGRCLVPVRAFYEQSAAETVASPRTGKPIRKPYRFTLAGSPAFLLAGIAEDGRFSIVTTAPNAQVAPVHNRMPLVLARGESAAWLAGDFARLADRGAVRLEVAGANEGADEGEGTRADETRSTDE